MRKLSNSELNRISVETYKETAKTPLVVVLDNVRSLNNIGSAFRTSDAFLIEAVYLCGITATPPHPEINKTALGAQNSVPWKHFSSTKDALEELMALGYTIFAIEQAEGSTMLPDFSPKSNNKLALIFGNEVKGVSEEAIALCNGCIEIPQYGTKHSLNISVSIGVVLWDITQKLRVK